MTTNTLAGPEGPRISNPSTDQELHTKWTKSWGPDKTGNVNTAYGSHEHVISWPGAGASGENFVRIWMGERGTLGSMWPVRGPMMRGEVGNIEFGFKVSGYPGTGRRTEAVIDLATCDRIELVQGAFMGDLEVRVGGFDFSTHFGWVTLLGWLLTLNEAANALREGVAKVARFAESEDFMSFRPGNDLVYIACSYAPGIASVRHEEFASGVLRFTTDSLNWVTDQYPECVKNPYMHDIVRRLTDGP